MNDIESKYSALTNYDIAMMCHRKSEDLLHATANLIVLLNASIATREPTIAGVQVEEPTTKSLVKVHAAGAHAMLVSIVDDIREIATRLGEGELVEVDE